jgi:hypothetical protein
MPRAITPKLTNRIAMPRSRLAAASRRTGDRRGLPDTLNLVALIAA